MPAAWRLAAAFSICCAEVSPHTASSAPQEMLHTSHPSAVALFTAEAMSCDQ
jgi:hypothetical protein